jgi:hypothetical protein
MVKIGFSKNNQIAAQIRGSLLLKLESSSI